MKLKISPEFEFKDLDCNAALNLDSNHVFSIAITESHLMYHPLYPKILSDAELGKAARFIRPEDSKRYLVCRLVLRNLLSTYLDIPPSEIAFGVTANKKPRVNGIEFNVSHSGNYILIAVSAEPIGIDIEEVRPDFDFKLLLNDFFMADERNLIENQSDTLVNFYRLWTRKEALLKATGEGLTDDMRSIDSLADQLYRNGQSYAIETFIHHKQYIWSLATLSGTKPLCYWNYHLL